MTGVMKERTRRAIAAPLAAGGAWAFFVIAHLFGTLREQWPTAVASGEQAAIYVNGLILLGFTVMASTSVVGGILLWRDKRWGRRLSKIVLAAQVLFIAVPHFQYKIALFGLLGFGLAGSRLGFFLESNTQMFLEFDPDDLRAFVVNIPAIVMLVALAKASSTVSETTQTVSVGASSTGAGTG